MRSVAAFAAACAALVAGPRAGAEDRPFVGPPAPMRDLKVIRTIPTRTADEDETVVPLAFSPDGRVLAGAEGKRVRFWDRGTGKELPAWDTEESKREGGGGINQLQFVDQRTVALHFAAGRAVQLRTYPNNKEIGRLDLGNEPVYALATSSGLIAATSASGPQSVRVWVGPKWEQAWRVEVPEGPDKRHPDSPRSVVFSPDRAELAVGTERGHVYVYRVKDGKLLRNAGPDKLKVTQVKVAYSLDGRELAVANGRFREGEQHPFGLCIWDAALKSLRTELKWGVVAGDESAQPYGCLFSPDGKTLVIPCSGKTVRLYETETGELRQVGRVPQEPMRAALSPDGRLLALRATDEGRNGIALVDWRAPAGARSRWARPPGTRGGRTWRRPTAGPGSARWWPWARIRVRRPSCWARN